MQATMRCPLAGGRCAPTPRASAGGGGPPRLLPPAPTPRQTASHCCTATAVNLAALQQHPWLICSSSGSSGARHWRAHRPSVRAQAAAPASEAEGDRDEAGGEEEEAGGIESLCAPDLAAPARRLQPKLSAKERAQRKTEAEDLVRQKKLVQVQIGAAGVTPPVLATLMDVLVKRSFVRVRCGVGRKERGALAKELERLLDAEVVHQVGFTITLFRQQGLARPAGCSCTPAAEQ